MCWERYLAQDMTEPVMRQAARPIPKTPNESTVVPRPVLHPTVELIVAEPEDAPALVA